MEEKGKGNNFDRAAWFDRQVHIRTRAALDAQGSKAKSRSREYHTEYARQIKLFRAERAEKKRRKAEKYAALLEKKLAAERAGVLGGFDG